MAATKRGIMNAQEFRSFLIEKARSFDRWAYKDQMDNPQDYANAQLGDWWQQFITFVENDID